MDCLMMESIYIPSSQWNLGSKMMEMSSCTDTRKETTILMRIRRQSGQLTLMATEITKSFGFRKMVVWFLEMLTPTNCIGHPTVVVLESTLIKLSCQKWVSSKSLTTKVVQSGQQIKHRAFATKVIS